MFALPIFRLASWVPLAALVAVELSIRRYDGWGAWASAPLLLLPAIISLPFIVHGIRECAAASRAGVPISSAVFSTFVAGIPVLWLFVRRFIT